jgi:hypothetical protein
MMAVYDRVEVLSAIGGVIGPLTAGEFELVAARGGLDAEVLKEGLAPYEGRLCPYPDELWSWLDAEMVLRPVPGTSSQEQEAVVPLWTEEGPARRGLRLRFTPIGRRGFLDVKVIGLEDVVPRPEWGSFTPATSREVPPVRVAPRGDNPVPGRWRPALREVVHRLAGGDFDGLARDEILAPVGHPSHVMIRSTLNDYGDRLVDLPDDPWGWSDFTPSDHGQGRYAIVLSLWTVSQSPSQLTLEADIDDRGPEGVQVQVIGAHVL